MDKQSEVKPKKRSLWAVLKESMDKASSGCGPGCGCHVEKPREGNREENAPASSGNDREKP